MPAFLAVYAAFSKLALELGFTVQQAISVWPMDTMKMDKLF